jgi:protein TonB
LSGVAAAALTWSVSVAAAGARLQVFFPADFKDQAYQQKVYDKVAGAWRRPAEHPKAGDKSVVIATVLRDGKATDLRLHYPSGSKAWDEAALAALQRAQPFPALPQTYSPTSVEVHFHFAYVQ